LRICGYFFNLFLNRKVRKVLRKGRKGFLPQKAHKKNKRNKGLTADAQIFFNRKGCKGKLIINYEL
jgi:predicted nuclease of restriction endonuclease-like RecB superfamily